MGPMMKTKIFFYMISQAFGEGWLESFIGGLTEFRDWLWKLLMLDFVGGFEFLKNEKADKNQGEYIVLNKVDKGLHELAWDSDGYKIGGLGWEKPTSSHKKSKNLDKNGKYNTSVKDKNYITSKFLNLSIIEIELMPDLTEESKTFLLKRQCMYDMMLYLLEILKIECDLQKSYNTEMFYQKMKKIMQIFSSRYKEIEEWKYNIIMSRCGYVRRNSIPLKTKKRGPIKMKCKQREIWMYQVSNNINQIPNFSKNDNNLENELKKMNSVIDRVLFNPSPTLSQ